MSLLSGIGGLIPGMGGGSSGGGAGGALGILAQLLDPLGLFGGKGGSMQTSGQAMQASPRPTPMTGPPMPGMAGQPTQAVGAPMPGARGPAANARDLQALLALLQGR